MTMTFRHNHIGVKIRRRRGMRRLLLSVGADGSVTLSAPHRTPLQHIERFLGQQARWLEHTFEKLGLTPHGLEARRAEARARYLAHREAARALVSARTAFFNAHYRVRVTGISVRDQSSRWGSASVAGRLSFNYRLALIDPALADYVVVHELCHLREMNHGERFWRLVAETVPDYRAKRRALRRLSPHMV